MSFDFYAEYPCINQYDVRRIVGDDRKAPYRELEDIYTRVQLLAQALIADDKEYAKNGHPKYGGGYKSLLHNRRGKNTYTVELIEKQLKLLDEMGLYPPSVDISTLPKYSVFLQFQFRLIRPFYSLDDVPFYIHENALSKDVIFKIPMVLPTTWKGNMRSAARLLGFDTKLIKRVFGDISKAIQEEVNEIVGLKGRIRLYPTFFDAIDLETVNPHSRKTKAGTIPVMLEVVPSGARGYFSLLYFPYELINKPEKMVRKQIAEDLDLISATVNAMMLAFGFGGKKNKGFGKTAYSFIRREDKVPTGKLSISGVEIPSIENRKADIKPQKADWRAKLQQIQTEEPSKNSVTFKDFAQMKLVIKKLIKNLKQ